METRLKLCSQLHFRHTGSFLFVVSPMRSFSSLLCPIRGSHPEISGDAEMHQSYLGRTDLDRLARRIRELTDNAPLRRYVLDKLLHNYRQIMPNVLERPDGKVLFLRRTAEDSLRSIVNVVRSLRDDNPRNDPEVALDYYVTWLEQMQQYSSALGARALFIEAETLVDDTGTALDTVSRWLGLDSKLSPEYKTFAFTGERGYGDPSSNIRRGSIVRDPAQRHRDDAEIAIPTEVIRRGTEAYALCRDVLSRNARRM